MPEIALTVWSAVPISAAMRVRAWAGVLAIVTTIATGCGGDNLELCDGCGPTRTPTPTVSVTPEATAPTPTAATPTATSTPTL